MGAHDAMNARKLIAVLFLLCLATSLSLQAQTKGGGAPVPYRLLEGSSLLAETTASPGGPTESRTDTLSGTFNFTKQASPLDWDVFQLESFRWLGLASRGGKGLEGTGSYSVTARFGNTKELNLRARIGGLAVELTSGAVANDANWPLLDIVARGTVRNGAATTTYTLRLVAAPELRVWHYRLFEGAYFMNDCPICDRVPIQEPMRGGFDLVLMEENPLFSRYLLRDINLTSSLSGFARKITGHGSFQIGGEVALRQQMTLELTVQSPDGTESKLFKESSGAVTKFWPMMDTSLDETEGTMTKTFRLRLNAAPLREIWFSIAGGFTSGNIGLADRNIGNADILSDLGRVVTRGADLFAATGVDPAGKPGVDAIAILPGGEQAFSPNIDVKGQPLGALQNGDLVSDRGRVVARNQDLLAQFGVMPPAPDVGLDAAQVLDSGEILFSIKTDVFSERLGVTLRHGDLLSNGGAVRKTREQLLAAFHPPNAKHDYGLDAIHVWPGGEVWFSVAEGFLDGQLGSISDGDLLSDQGYIVFRNLELLGAFAPLEKPTNFGLDGLFLVTDVSEPAGAPALAAPRTDRLKNSATLGWTGKGRVFQVEKTQDLLYPFTPTSPIIPGASWTDNAAVSASGFYRLRQW